MSKTLVKFVILLVVVSVVYSVFWFFKAGQLHKQVESFVGQNSNYVSVGEVAVSGFPLAQKVTIKDLKFSVPGSLLSNRQTIVKHLEAKAGVFSSDFVITLPEPVTLQDSDNNTATVEFSKEPEIKASIADGRLAKFSYQDFGYRILDAEKNTIYAASSSTITVESVLGADDALTTKFSANIKDIEGFDAVDIYKNVFEKKITEGLKTGEIVLGSAVAADPAAVAAVDHAAAPVVADAAAAVAPAVAAPAVAAVVDPAAVVAPVDPAAAAANPAETLAAAATDNNLVKSNFSVEIEYSLMPNKDEQKAQIPTDPTQIQEIPVQHNKSIKITSLEFSNPLYKINITSDKVEMLSDDNMPSGSLAIKVEKIDNLINQLVLHLAKMTEQKAPVATTEVQSVDLAGNGTLSEDAYQNFLKKFSSGLAAVTKEVAAKNPVSTGEIAEFDLRREKNLEFLINETSVREILGKF
ncbi:MAG: hypothetical protein KA100_03175 [Rickettsiales bacterium]|nr:hypothetical protein [Rickettsiales bacterium]